MKNQTQQSTNKVSEIFVLILGALITLVLILSKYFNILNLDLEVVFAPLLVFTLLTYGEPLLILLISPMGFAFKLINKKNLNKN